MRENKFEWEHIHRQDLTLGNGWQEKMHPLAPRYKLCVLYGSKDAVAYGGDMTLLNRCFYKNISQSVTYVLTTKKF